jgi:hypothetical protein
VPAEHGAARQPCDRGRAVPVSPTRVATTRCSSRGPARLVRPVLGRRHGAGTTRAAVEVLRGQPVYPDAGHHRRAGPGQGTSSSPRASTT